MDELSEKQRHKPIQSVTIFQSFLKFTLGSALIRFTNDLAINGMSPDTAPISAMLN